MKIWVDADACPTRIKDILCRAAGRVKIQTIFIANKRIILPVSAFISFIQVDLGSDIADDYITHHCNDGDLVITADIPLAVRITDKNAIGIDFRGTLYDKTNIGGISDMRNFMHKLRENGIDTGGPKIFNAKDVQKFANQLDKILRHLTY